MWVDDYLCCARLFVLWLLQYISAELPADSAADPTAGDRKVWAVIAYIMTALTVLLFLFTLVMLRRIKIAVATLKVRMDVTSSSPVTLSCSRLACHRHAHLGPRCTSARVTCTFMWHMILTPSTVTDL